MTESHSATKDKVVLLPFPFDDLTGTKVRPAVCLTEPIGRHEHVVVAFISSRTPDEFLATDVVVRQGDPGFPATGLRLSSTIRLHRLMTVAAGLIRRELGMLSPALQSMVAERLRLLFG